MEMYGLRASDAGILQAIFQCIHSETGILGMYMNTCDTQDQRWFDDEHGTKIEKEKMG